MGVLFVVTTAAAIAGGVVRSLFRWRTWRDRGLIVLALEAAAVGLAVHYSDYVGKLFSAAEDLLPASGVMLPAFFGLLGLLGVNPLVVVLVVWLVGSSQRLFLLCALPAVLGNLPQTVFLMWTMPPSGTPAEPRSSAGEGAA